MSENISVRGILEALPKKYADTKIIYKEILDSTNNLAKEEALLGTSERLIVLADAQTSGRGRRGREFYSPKGSGLYLSAVCYPKGDTSNITKITVSTAVGICEVLKELCGINAQIKWVNDVFIGDKKVCGILTEALSDKHTGKIRAAVVGVGINIRTKDFPKEIEGIAGALNVDVDKSELAARICAKIFDYADCMPKDIIKRYEEKLFVIGKEVGFFENGVLKKGISKGVDENGGLVILVGNEEKVLNSGEISIKI